MIAGHSLLDSLQLTGGTRRVLTGPLGAVDALEVPEWPGVDVILQRHGLDAYQPAYRIDHPRHLGALAAAGIDRILALSSVGSLRTDLPVGSLVVPDDFIALDAPYRSAFEDARCHVVPGFDVGWRATVVAAGPEALDGGVYWQANGPRFETPAEVRYLAQHADVVGMTVGSECIAACELGIAYVAVCMVDNLANGLDSSSLTLDGFEKSKAANVERLSKYLESVLTDIV